MTIPSSVKFKKDGVEYLNNVDRCNYLMTELVRAALKDTGRYICQQTKKMIHKKTGRLNKNIQYWVRKKSGDLQVGFKPGGFYGMYQEFGTEKTPKIGALSTSAESNVETIRKIQAQYLSYLNDEQTAVNMVDESEGIGSEE
ncbi:MAG: HK97-gp10 family putative phage morphogenesis protein [Acetivibrio ethanolgignens]